MKSEYFMNRVTGELLEDTLAIKEFYRTHGALESWLDEWQPTGEYSDMDLEAPNFSAVWTA